MRLVLIAWAVLALPTSLLFWACCRVGALSDGARPEERAQ